MSNSQSEVEYLYQRTTWYLTWKSQIRMDTKRTGSTV
ncbi:MAG: hypothetical protein QOC83_3388, partial [Pseudonocardiales bacterium]|nr:hypothetical protein [Pseudonocardiales bacterium]